MIYCRYSSGDRFDLFRVQLFGHGRIAGKIGEKNL